QHPGWRAAVAWDEGELGEIICLVLRLVAAQEGKPFPIRAPRRPASVRAREVRELLRRRAGASVYDEDVIVPATVGLRRRPTHESDLLPVGRPARRIVV